MSNNWVSWWTKPGAGDKDREESAWSIWSDSHGSWTAIRDVPTEDKQIDNRIVVFTVPGLVP